MKVRGVAFRRMLRILPLLLLALPGVAVAQGQKPSLSATYTAAGRLTATVFDPDRIFAGEFAANSMEEVTLTVAASARDDAFPAYSLAAAYTCKPEGADTIQCGYTVRMLRVNRLGEDLEPTFKLAREAATARSEADLSDILDDAKLEWVQAELFDCKGGLEAYDAIRLADWRPGLHHGMNENPDMILHPAQIRVMMMGDGGKSTYQGWVFNPGVPAAVARFLDVMEPCWKPAKAPPPWHRPGRL